MRDVASAALSGNLTRDVELRALPSGAKVARVRVATTTRHRVGEEWVDQTNYFTVEVLGAHARSREVKSATRAKVMAVCPAAQERPVF
jgi:single-stranded DNA-binding protein